MALPPSQDLAMCTGIADPTLTCRSHFDTIGHLLQTVCHISTASESRLDHCIVHFSSYHSKSTMSSRPRFLLSIDGGGALELALTSLYTLKHIMKTVHRRCDSFDLICGTGTGGLIAIMLGSGKSIQECIKDFKASRKAERETAISKCIKNLLKSVGDLPPPNETPFIYVTAVEGQKGVSLHVHDVESRETAARATVAIKPFFEKTGQYFVSTE